MKPRLAFSTVKFLFCLSSLAFWVSSSEAFSSVTVSLSNYEVNAWSDYTISGSDTSMGLLILGTLTLGFPAGTEIDNGIAASDVTVNSFPALEVTRGVGDRLIITSPVIVLPGYDIVIQINHAKIQNAHSAGAHSLTLDNGSKESGSGSYTLIEIPDTATPSHTCTPSATPTLTPTPTCTPSRTATSSATATPSRTSTLTQTVSATLTASLTETPSTSITPTLTESATLTATPTRTATPTSTASRTQTVTATQTPTRTASTTSTCSPTRSITPTVTQTGTITLTTTISATTTSTITPTPTWFPTSTATATQTITPYELPENSVISYPSPAKGREVWFYFNLGKPGRISLELYNSLGEKTEALETELEQAGYGRLKWDLSDVAPGIYLYRTKIESRDGQVHWIKIQKIAVVKGGK